MQARLYEPETVPRRDDRDGPRPGANAQAHGGATAPREQREEERRDESLEEPGYGHGV